MRRTRSLLGMGLVLGLAWGLAWAGDPVPMFGDFFTRTPDAIPEGRGAFKIAENESPQPQDRVFINYNFFSDLTGHVNGRPRDAHRETIGVEKTVLGDGSIGLRLPFLQETNNFFRREGGTESSIDDLSLILKYAPIHNRETGNTLSFGLVVTPPTGERPRAFFGPEGVSIHPTLLQPFVGYVWTRGDFFLHAFHSLMVPTDSRDVTVLFNDIGLGYWALQAEGGQLLSGIIPTLELHVNTPLNHRSTGDLPRYRDSVDLTAGVHVELKRQALLGIAVATPVTGPRLFDVEVIANFNYRF